MNLKYLFSYWVRGCVEKAWLQR